MTLPPTDRLSFSNVVLSPDGRELVYLATRDGVTQIFRRSMDKLDVTPLRGTEGASFPFFSPDGGQVGFFADGKLKKVSLAGGPPAVLCDATATDGAAWGADDVIVFASRGLFRVSAGGGAPEALTRLSAGERRPADPNLLPGGKAVLFTALSGAIETSRIAVLSLSTREQRELVEGVFPRYAPTGHIVFGRANSLWAVPFDADRLELTGEPKPVLEGVQVTGDGMANFALSGDGSLAYASVDDRVSYVWVDRKGNEERLKAGPREYGEFALSPDGTRIAVNIYADPTEVWTYDLERDIWTRLTFDPTEEERPIWSPDGRHVAFGPSLSWKAVDGTGEIEPLREGSSQQFPNAFSPDGALLVFEDRKSGDLGLLSLSGELVSTVLLGTEYVERNAALSPDGRFIAYQSNESGRFEIYVRPFPEVSAGRWQVSNDGGGCPFWARDGRELFYVGPQAIMSVGIETEPSFALGRSGPLFATAPYVNVTGATLCRVAGSADGRFLLLKEGGGSEGAAAPQSIVIVQNWFEELKALVPVK